MKAKVWDDKELEIFLSNAIYKRIAHRLSVRVGTAQRFKASISADLKGLCPLKPLWAKHRVSV